jgi:hypothetical protein
MIGALVHFVRKMSGKDRYCTLLFDEMSVRENVHFNQKFDCMDGFKDLGNQGRICHIVITALMVLRILEIKAGHATLRIMLWFSLSMACVESISDQWLATLVMEAQRLR